MADWFYIGYCVAIAECVAFLAWLAKVNCHALRKLSLSHLLALSILAFGTSLDAQKTNQLLRVIGGFLWQGMMGETVEGYDIARGWRVECAATNENISYEMPTNAALVGNWHVHGASSSFGNNRIDFGDWRFPLGTNNATFSSFWYFVDGRIRPTPKDAVREICAVGVPMSAVPGQSRLWRLDGDDGSRILTWENFFLGGDTNCPVNAQIVLWPNGDFITRSNEVETVCRRVNPDDWDDDGNHNERDANPTIYDGDLFGVANALPPNANHDAYYWLDLSVTGLLDCATIRVTCDGPSDLGDHLIVARTNEVCHVPLLAGATYAVDSSLPIDYSAVSTEYAEIVTNAENHLTVSLPLELSLVRMQMRSAGSAINYGAASSPINVYPSIIACLGGCCSRQVVDGMLQWSCSLTCTCGGGHHSIETTALWEGYSKLFVGYASCGCWEDAPDPTPTPSDGPYAASVSANFSKDAVIFEDAYENMPGEWVSRRSTATMLTISANGGTNGAVLSVSATNLGKLQKNSGPTFPAHSVSVPARQSITYAMNYVGQSASDTADDIEVVATLTDNVTGESITNDCQATSVRLELAAVYEAPENSCTNRHIYGVGEKVKCKHIPQASSLSWDIVGLEYNNNLLVGDDCDCILEFSYIAAEVPNLRASCDGAEYSPELALIEPTDIECRHVEWDGFRGAIGVAGGFGMNLDLYVLPMTVSFQGIDMVEEPCNVVIPPTGYYASTNFNGELSHTLDAQAGWWNHVKQGNRWTLDNAFANVRYPPWSDGVLHWKIPVAWYQRFADEQYSWPRNSLEALRRRMAASESYLQTFTMTEGGTITISKFGHGISRTTNDVIRLDGVIVNH